MNNKLKISALALAVSIGAAGWTYAQSTPDGQAASIHQTPATDQVPEFMQAMNTEGASDPVAVPQAAHVAIPQAAPEAAPDSSVPVVQQANEPAPSAAIPPVQPEIAPVAGAPIPPAMNAGVVSPGVDAPPTISTGLTKEEERFFREQASLQRETRLMEARVKLMEQRAKYEEAMRKMAVSAPMPPKVGTEALAKSEYEVASSYDVHIATDEKALAEMTLVSVYGEDKSLVGELFYRGGRMTVKKGDTLPGGWRVASIDLSRLMLSKGKRRFEIALGSPQSTAAAASRMPFAQAVR